MRTEFRPAGPYIIGERLREARTARGLTITQLSSLTGIKKQSISNYEKGSQKPGGERLATLLNALGISLAFVQKNASMRSTRPIYFRSFSAQQARERERARVLLGWFEELYDFLCNHIDFVPPNIPADMDISNRLGKVGIDEIDEMASRLRSFWGLGNGPIHPLTRLLENNGIFVLKMDLDIEQEDAFSQMQQAAKLPVIVSVADTLAACRQRFSLAHELGHIILHSRLNEIDKEKLPLIEAQAHRFASAFLLPERSWAKEFYSADLESFRILKERWKVSIAAQIHRAQDLELISESAARNLYIGLSKRKWRSREPLDDIIPIEEPTMLSEAAKLLTSQLGMTIGEICAETALPEIDVRKLLNCPEYGAAETGGAHARIETFHRSDSGSEGDRT